MRFGAPASRRTASTPRTPGTRGTSTGLEPAAAEVHVAPQAPAAAMDEQSPTVFGGALAQHPRIFPELYVSMVQAGEASGTLGTILERLAAYLELQRNLQRRMSGVLAYPALMVVTGFSVVFFLLSFVIPRVAKIFDRANRDLPWPTQVLISGTE